MEMEHINENTIKVVIDKTDLEKRGITFLDLLGNQRHVENFFHSILEEVGAQEQFQGSETVTFQVVPKHDSIDLYITKGLVDSESVKDMISNVLQDNRELKTPLDKVIQTFKKESPNSKKDFDTKNPKYQFDETTLIQQIFKFETIAQLVDFAKKYYQYNFGMNNLYTYEDSFYLTCKLNKKDGANQQLSLQEHAEKVRMSLSYLKEHGHLIIENDAINIIKKQF